jgi:hypothetical protein
MGDVGEVPMERRLAVGRDRARHLVALLLLLALFAGCTSQPGPSPTSGRGQALSGPFTFTVSTPNPVSPTSPVLVGSDSVNIGANSTVVSGTTVDMGKLGLVAGPFAALNDVWSAGPVVLLNNVEVRGTLHATNVVPGLFDSIGASDTTPRINPPSTLTWNVTFPQGNAANVTVLPGQAQTAKPGVYGNVLLGPGSTLTLSTGTYYLDSLNLPLLSTVSLNQTLGPVIIYILNSFVYQGTFVSSSGGAPDLFVGYMGSLPVILSTLFDGAIVAPNAQLQIGPVQGVHTGFFAAFDLQLLPLAEVQYSTPLAMLTAAGPSGSQCLQLLGDASVPAQAISLYCPLCSSPDDTDRDGVPDCVDGCPYDPLKVKPGVCGCNTPDTDSDGDGFPDCIDECPADPNNVTPGECGCVGLPGLAAAGTACTDTACPQSGATCNGAGVCGNRGNCNPCSSGGAFFEEDGLGYWMCGNTLTAATVDGGAESISTGSPATESSAQSACSAKGLTLTRINSSAQNHLIASLINAPLWLGANDLTTSGQWRWSLPGSNNGDLFWSGGPTGTIENGLYSSWGTGAPGSAQCASMSPGKGSWFDTPCSEALGYVCEYAQPPPGLPADAGSGGWPNGGGGGGAHQPVPMPDAACVDPFNLDAGGLPDSLAELINEVDAARNHNFYGIAANPPPDGSTCPSESPDAALSEAIGLVEDGGAGCWYTNAQLVNFPDGGLNGAYTGSCASDQDCTNFVGAGYVCRQLKNVGTCAPPDAGAAGLDAGACPGFSYCVQLQCPSDTNTCREIQLCPQTQTAFDSGLDPSSSLDAGAFDPANLFEGGLPDAGPSAEYVDPSEGDGSANTWCYMSPQHPVATANQPAQNTGGSSGHGSTISFGFDPNLVFSVNANPLAFGENGMNLHAAATLKATVNLNGFLGQNYQADIVDIGAGIRAQRCSVNNDETTFTILGIDITALTGIGVPHFDSSQGAFATETQECNSAVADFTLAANRAKKAFRDAQQLIAAYKTITGGGAQMANTLCEEIMSTVNATGIANFPGGLSCPAGETAEETINRFVDYLQAPGIGQISQVRQAAMSLVQKSTAIVNGVIPKLDIQFLDVQQNESQTILNVPFAIGPVPMVLQVDVFANYGINGRFKLQPHSPLALFGLDDSNTTQPGDTTAQPIEIAHVEADVIPYAAAGLSAFVGAGVDLGAFSADVGIEGSVTLGQVSAPVYAGAGLDVLEQFDPRPVPSDISAASLIGDVLGTKFQFSVPKSFNMLVWFDYGAGIQLSNVLSGEIDARLHISLLFFSETWRIQIVKFTGWSHFYNLINGNIGAATSSSQSDSLGTSHLPAPTGSTTVVSTGLQGPSAGLAEQQLPLTVLTHLAVPDAGPLVAPVPDAGEEEDASDAGTPPVVHFDASTIKGFFYDSLCCAHNQESCHAAGTPQCCPDYQCTLDDAGDLDSGVCQPICVLDGGSCLPDGGPGVGCCAGFFCGAENTCLACNDFGLACGTNMPCCGPSLGCGSTGTCCINEGYACGTGTDCCGGYCTNGVCGAPLQ